MEQELWKSSPSRPWTYQSAFDAPMEEPEWLSSNRKMETKDYLFFPFAFSCQNAVESLIVQMLVPWKLNKDPSKVQSVQHIGSVLVIPTDF